MDRAITFAKFALDGEYEGGVLNGKLDGFGKIKLKDGRVFEGQFISGEIHGTGTLINANRKTTGYFICLGNDLCVAPSTSSAESEHAQTKLTASESDDFHFKGAVEQGKFMDGVGKVDLDKAIFTGQFQNGKPHGEGALKFVKSNDLFVGHFQNGLLHGKGMKCYSTGVVVEGWFEKGAIAQGEVVGQVIHNRKKYEGGFKDGVPHDEQGVLNLTEGKFKGAIVNGIVTGKGSLTFNNDFETAFDSYVGDFVDLQFHGKGELKFRNGDRYEGQFQQNMMEGQGKLIRDRVEYEGLFKKDTIISGRRSFGHDIYKGEFQDKLFHGCGLLCNSDGTIYEGNFIAGKREGSGVFTVPGQYQYIGTFTDDEMTGEGTIIFDDGREFRGEVVKGQPAKGSMTYSSSGINSKGDVFVGEFLAGDPTRGILLFAGRGEEIDQKWIKKAQDLNEEVLNEFKMSPLTFYYGSFKDGYREDINGYMRWEDGDSFKGVFQRGKRVSGELTIANGSESMLIQSKLLEKCEFDGYGSINIEKIVFTGIFKHAKMLKGLIIEADEKDLINKEIICDTLNNEKMCDYLKSLKIELFYFEFDNLSQERGRSIICMNGTITQIVLNNLEINYLKETENDGYWSEFSGKMSTEFDGNGTIEYRGARLFCGEIRKGHKFRGIYLYDVNRRLMGEQWIEKAQRNVEEALIDLKSTSFKFYFGGYKNGSQEDENGYMRWPNGASFSGKFEKEVMKSGKHTFAPGAVWKEYEGQFSDKVQFEGREN